MIYLRDIKKENVESTGFPFNVPAIASLSALTITSPVVFFVGANASGKSTLLESIAIASKRIVVGGN